jgi:hypothetical protein
MEKRYPLQQLLLGNLIFTCKRLKLDPCLSPCTKTKPKWIKYLNIRPETFKKHQEAIGNTLEQISIGNNFLNRAQRAQHLRETMNKWDSIKLKIFCTANETADSRDSPQNGRRSLPATHLIK